MASAVKKLRTHYNLLDLTDMALKVPEVGAVNFNILHTILRAMITELNLNDIRPLVNFENPELAKKLLEESKDDGQKDETPPEEGKDHTETTPADDSQPKPQEDPDKRETTDKTQLKPQEDPNKPETADDSQTKPQEGPPKPETADESQPKTQEDQPETTATTATTQTENETKPDKRRQRRPVLPDWDELSEKLEEQKENLNEVEKLKNVAETAGRIHLGSRMKAAEEGLTKLTHVTDVIVARMKRNYARRKPGELGSGPIAAAIETLEEKMEDMEIALEEYEEDHGKLVNVEFQLEALKTEFQDFKDLAAQIEAMKKNIDTKANAQEVEDALALKSDQTVVDTKVDHLEFVTAIEELGEAFGLLGLKVQKRNDERNEQDEITRRLIDTKMTRDVFDEAMSTIRERIKALMFGLKSIDEVVKKALFPDAGAVTKCLVCSRPADISGHECILGKSPKRPLKSSEETVFESEDLIVNIQPITEDVSHKKAKTEKPPYSSSTSHISFSVPFSNKEETFQKTKNETSTKDSQSNEKNNKDIFASTTRSMKTHPIAIPKLKKQLPHRELYFTKKMLAERNISNDPSGENLQSTRNETKKTTTKENVAKTFSEPSQETHNMEEVYSKALLNFPPLKYMEDPLRKTTTENDAN